MYPNLHQNAELKVHDPEVACMVAKHLQGFVRVGARDITDTLESIIVDLIKINNDRTDMIMRERLKDVDIKQIMWNLKV